MESIKTALSRRGQVIHTTIPLGQWPGGGDISIPLIIINGSKLGSVLWAQAAVHGGEVGGTVALLDIAKKLEPKNITGSLILAPVINLPAFRANDRNNPLDHKNLNRVFPGSLHLDSSDQMALSLLQEAVKVSDVIVDLHSGGTRSVVPHYALTPRGETNAHEEAFSLAKFIAPPTIWFSSDTWLKGSMLFQAVSEGIPSVLVETGGGIVTKRDIANYQTAVFRSLAWAKMLKNRHTNFDNYFETRGESSVPTIVDNCSVLYTTCGGIFIPRGRPGGIYDQGHTIGEIVSIFSGEVQETYRCKKPRAFVAALPRPHSVLNSGSFLSEEVEVIDDGTLVTSLEDAHWDHVYP